MRMRQLFYVIFSLQVTYAAVTVTVTPADLSLRAGTKKQFTAKVVGTDTKTVTWSVNGVTGGSPDLGQISDGGLYTAPAVVPQPNSVSISATSKVDTTAKGSVNVAVLNPVPVIQSLSPNQVNVNLPFPLIVKGTGFVAGSKVMMGDTPLTT